MDSVSLSGVVVGVFLLVLAVCWVVLPFAVIGLKPLVRELLAEVRKLNQREREPYKGL